MKYKVKELLDKNNTVSHLFLDCVGDSVDGTNVVSLIISEKDYSMETSEVDIQLTVNGHEIKIDNFLDHLSEEYFRLIDEKAKEKFHNQFPKAKSEDVEELKTSINELIENYKGILFSTFDKK